MARKTKTRRKTSGRANVAPKSRLQKLNSKPKTATQSKKQKNVKPKSDAVNDGNGQRVTTRNVTQKVKSQKVTKTVKSQKTVKSSKTKETVQSKETVKSEKRMTTEKMVRFEKTSESVNNKKEQKTKLTPTPKTTAATSPSLFDCQLYTTYRKLDFVRNEDSNSMDDIIELGSDSDSDSDNDSGSMVAVIEGSARMRVNQSPDLFESDSAVEMESPDAKKQSLEDNQVPAKQVQKSPVRMVSIGIQCCVATNDVAVGADEQLFRDFGAQTSPLANPSEIIYESYDDDELDSLDSSEESECSYSEKSEDCFDDLDDFDMLEDLEKIDQIESNVKEIQHDTFDDRSSEHDVKSIISGSPPRNQIFVHHKFHSPETACVEDDEMVSNLKPDQLDP